LTLLIAVSIEISKTEDPNSSHYKDVGLENLVNTLNDLFLAGAETTSSSLLWCMLYMTREQGVQKKIQDELDRVVGRDRLPSLSDKPDLPYTEAVILEVLRCGNIAPFGIYHFNSVPLEVNGITIPANTMILPMFTELLKGDYWGSDGKVFR